MQITAWHIILLFFGFFIQHLVSDGLKLVCYYGSWAIYREEPTIFTPNMLDQSGCTHIIYSFAGLDEKTGKIVSLDTKMDLDQGRFDQ